MIKSLDGTNTCVVVAPDTWREGKPRVVYCLPRWKEGRTAGVLKKDWCPVGWRESGSYCIR
jgi:hypothetical protein